MSRKLEEIVIVYRSERIRFDETAISSADRVLVHDGKPKDGKPVLIAIKGVSSPDEFQSSQSYRLYGKWSKYKNKRTHIEEWQFHFQTFVRCQPHGRAGTINYLKTADHVGQKTAEKLWEKFGGDAVRILRESPDVAVSAVNAKYFTLSKAEEAAKYLEQESSLEGCTIDLIDALHGRGFPKATARAAVAKWGNKAAEIIKRCPYYLMNFRGCGFLKTDAMYLDLGLPSGKLKRQALCTWHSIATESSGDVWYPIGFVEKALRSKISSAVLNPVGALTLGKRAKMINTRRDSEGRLWIAEAAVANAEKNIAELLAETEDENERCHIPDHHSWPEPAQLSQFIDKHQVEKLQQSLMSKIAILSGSPGTGKTYTAAALIRLLISEFGESQVAVAAPTGKAAVRVSENLQAYGVILRAKTIHSLLGVQRSSDSSKGVDSSSSWSFVHNHNNPLPYRFIIVDESSMIDNSLMSCFLSARATGTHILFVGDINQLPPVGRGAPLRDMISAGISNGELTEIRRNSGRIVKSCHLIKSGNRFDVSRKIDLHSDDPENLYSVVARNPEDQIKKMFLGISAAKSDGLDPVWDVQVIVPVNARSQLSRKALNEILQRELNPKGETIGSNPFRVGDKIVCLKNGFLELDEGQSLIDDLEPENTDEVDEDGKVYVANGELAEVLHVEEFVTIAKLTNPERVVKIIRGKAKSDDSKAGGPSKSGSLSDSKLDTGCNWDLGYALSCHKSQGSEWPTVIVMIDEYPGARLVCSREWIYTAISRAKRLCLLVGKLGTAHSMCRREALSKRKTFLVELIDEGRESLKVNQFFDQETSPEIPVEELVN